MVWLIPYFKWELFEREKIVANEGEIIHILVIFVDHFEPEIDRTRNIRVNDLAFERWISEYPLLASRHRDADGKYPQHTWFYPYDAMNMDHLRALSKLVYEGFGEIELHMHHYNDSSESFERKLQDAIRKFNQVGALLTSGEKPEVAFAFIHGKWALDDCDGSCGVKNELTILKRNGCFADFGLPPQNLKCFPSVVNKVFYAVDDPNQSGSFETGPEVFVGGLEPANALMMIPGPFRIDWRDWRFIWHPMVEEGEIKRIRIPSPSRVDMWVETNIHVRGRPNWIFVKLFTHGAVEEDLDALLGDPADQMYDYLERKYNDGRKYKLHYVTAREAYNIIKAAEAGMKGDPNDYRDFVIKKYYNRHIQTFAN
jgi:hypothetical protein